MLNHSDYYADDDAVLKSPGLTAVVVKTTPSPTPPPIVTASAPFTDRQGPDHSHNQKGLHRHRFRARPTQGDLVLLREMDPNRPDIAQRASEQALNCDTDSGSEMEVESPAVVMAPTTLNGANSASARLQSMVQHTVHEPFDSRLNPKATATHRDSVLEDDFNLRPIGLLADRRPSQASSVLITSDGMHRSLSSASAVSNTSLKLPSQQIGGLTNGASREINSSASPGLRQLTIPQPRAFSTDTLPALQAPSPARDGSAASPVQQLPSFRHMDDIARSASSDHEANRANSFSQRQSVSSVGQSPTSRVRQLSISSHSPATPFTSLSGASLSASSLNASSPMSANEPPQRGDLFLRTAGGGAFGDSRRPSHAASDCAPYNTLHSASSESYQSSDGLSPATQPTPIEQRPRHMSLDGALASRVLPPPVGSGLPPSIPSHATGSFKCDHPGCTAAPFQTQYLLNSHTNVHSSNRPHYCPVKDCPRGEGGKGFKRKNEMIRHGLVHQSPGYVCPFCPDREHKYPRPDNLQRHVRVHHPDKDKDDPQLRDVLAQRPEGGSRGRRRRVSDSGH
jgi:hypothetical protein